MTRVMLLFLVIAVAGTGLAAQPQMGDIVLSEGGTYKNVAYINKSAKVLTSLSTQLPSGPIGLMMAKDNTNLVTMGGPNVHTITPKGLITTLASAASGTGSFNGGDLMQNGFYALSASIYGKTGYIKQVDPVTGAITTLFTQNISHYRELTVNQDKNALLVCIWGSYSDLLEFDLASQTKRVVKGGFFGLNDVDVEPASGNFLCGTHYTGGRIQVYTPTGTLVTTHSVPWGSGLKVDDASGNYFCVTGKTAPDTVIEMDSKGTIINTYGPFAGHKFNGIDIYGSKQVTGVGTAKPGTAYLVDFCFPGLPGITYVGALSFASRPGLVLGGSKVNLAPDGLFWLSLQGVLVSNFQGTLNTAGRAQGKILIPSYAPKGLTIYCSAIATNGINLVTGNSIGITIN